MKTTTGLFVLLSVAVACVFANNNDLVEADLPVYSNCTSSDDCAHSFCCLASEFRYSVPSCQPVQVKGEICRPGEPFFTSGLVAFPNGEKFEVKQAHRFVCPCADGLVCARSRETQSREAQCREA